jgi:hypothetical protein
VKKSLFNGKMYQTQQTTRAQKPQNLNQTSIITYSYCLNGTICIVSIDDPRNPKNHFFGNGIGIIVPMNRITKNGDTQTPPDNQKQYALHFENGKWNCYLDGNLICTFDEIFGLPEGNSSLENISFHQVKYVPTVVDEKPEMFREILRQLVSAYPDRFCLEDPAKRMTAHVGGMKVRIPKPIFDLVKQLLVSFGVSTCSFVEHLINGSTIGVSRGDMDFYVLDEKQVKLIIDILTKLGFLKNSTDKSNNNTFRIYLDVLCQKFSHEAIMPNFLLLEGSDPAQCYIEVEIKIATKFQKAYESNCLGYFLGLLLSHYFKITNSGVSLKHGCDEIPINVGSLDEFLKKLGINLDEIRTNRDFIERLLDSPLISELLTVDDILRLFKNIMGDEKTKHTSKPLREWLHLLVCGLKKRFPDRFSSLRSELKQEIIQDEKSGQMIPTWSVRLFSLNKGSEFEVQMEKGILLINCGKKQFVSTGVDGKSLIFSEKQLKSQSGKKPLPERVKSCSMLFELLKEYFDYLKEINTQRSVIERFIDALGCRSEVCSHLEQLRCELIKKIHEELMNPLYPVSRKKPDSMDGKLYGDLMKQFQPAVIVFSQFKLFCVVRFGLVGDYQSFVDRMLNEQIFAEYNSQIGSLSPDLSPEDHKKKRGEIYASAILNIEKLCLELVQQWTSFHNSDVNWRDEGIREFHIPSQTYHETSRSDWRPYYLGTSVLGGTNVHVFMDGESGEVFTMAIE